MEPIYAEKLVTSQSIYIDSKRLLEWLYFIRWKVNKRDRAYLFDTLLIPLVLDMIGHFRRGYQFKEERLKEIYEFLYAFDRVEALIDLASSQKIISDKHYTQTFVWITRIRDSMKKWRVSTKKAKNKTVTQSNDEGDAEMEISSRGGDGLI